MVTFIKKISNRNPSSAKLTCQLTRTIQVCHNQKRDQRSGPALVIRNFRSGRVGPRLFTKLNIRHPNTYATPKANFF